MELFHSLVHSPWQRPSVQSHDGVVGASGIWDQRRHGLSRSLNHRLWQCRHSGAADRTRRNGTASNTCKLKKLSSGCHLRPSFNQWGAAAVGAAAAAGAIAIVVGLPMTEAFKAASASQNCCSALMAAMTVLT